MLRGDVIIKHFWKKNMLGAQAAFDGPPSRPPSARLSHYIGYSGGGQRVFTQSGPWLDGDFPRRSRTCASPLVGRYTGGHADRWE
jgi:hypothetical protein